MRARVRLRRALLALTLALLVSAAPAPLARADFGIAEWGVGYTGAGGAPLRQAGSHGELRTRFSFNLKPNAVYPEYEEPDKNVKDVSVALPPGYIANAAAIPACPESGLVGGENGNITDCPIPTQVGIATIETYGLPELRFPIYNVVRPANLPALFGFNVLGIVVELEPSLRPGEGYAISADSRLISQGQALKIADITLWGVPASHVHDNERFLARDFEEGEGGFSKPRVSQAPQVPFVTVPTSCPGTPGAFSISADSWQLPGIFSSRSTTTEIGSGEPLTTVGCDRLPFAPTASVRPLGRAAAQPGGLSFELDLPQDESPDGLATADVRQVKLGLPQGVTISPSAAAGLGACGMREIGLGSNDPPSCPASSQIGTVSVDTPLLGEPLTGELYLARQGENPFGTLLANYLVLRGPGILIKLPGRIDADPANGRLTATFSDTPQLPFSHLRVNLRGGATAPLALPSACGVYTARTEVTSWASPVPVLTDSSFRIDEGCSTGGFAPKLLAGTTDPSAGRPSPFNLRIVSGSGEANLSRIVAKLPEGLLAKLAGVPLCGEAGAATGACPAASRIGSVTVGAGPGPSPVFLPEAGRAPTAVYLAGPYRGAPYSLVVSVPAQAGPFDLGTVLVRNALRVDPETTAVTVESDPLPQILQGIPVTYRDLRVDVDRPDFTVNPTSCEKTTVGSVLTSADGATASPSAPFKASNCASLRFAPKLGLRLAGPTRRGAFPALTATLTFPGKGASANVGRASVALPHSEFLEQGHIGTVCTRVQFAAGAVPGEGCPARSVYGEATVKTPLLDKPLRGPVYLRSSSHELPDLVAALHGSIDVVLDGRIDSVRGGIRTTFSGVPDAPVERFVLRLRGGKRGLLVNSTDLCKGPNRATVGLRGQNGALESLRPLVRPQCKE